MTERDGASLRWQRGVLTTLHDTSSSIGPEREKPIWRRVGGDERVAHWSLTYARSRYFVKVADPASAHVLDAERDGLRAIAQTRTVSVPAVIGSAHDADAAWLVLEWLEIATTGGSAALGDALARMHDTTAARFGWHEDNAIGPTAQRNAWRDGWAAFFRDQRLRPQLDLACRNGYAAELARDGEQLLERVSELLADHAPDAALVHGDLWSGNAASLRNGTPVLYDPAVYYGDPETDLAMTRLFGGFDDAFYAAYASRRPRSAGHERRCTLYNVYHVLNHLNLFGGSYLAHAKRMIAALLADR